MAELATSMRLIRDIATSIAGYQTVPEIVGAIATSLQDMAGDPAITVGIVLDDGPLRLMALDGFDPDTLDRWGSIDREQDVPLTEVLRTGEVLYFSTRDQLLGRYPHLRADVERNHHHAWAAVPLLSEIGPAGTIGLAWTAPKEFSAVERLVLVTLGKLGGEALRRASREIDRSELVVLLADASDEDRIEIARDLHDQSVQRLAAASIRLGSLRMDLADGDVEDLPSRLEVIESEVQAVIRTLRNIIGELHPPDMSGLDLRQSLEDYCEWLFAHGIEYDVRVDVDLAMTDPAADTAFRVATEALSNVMRHSGAQSVSVDIDVVDDGRSLRLVVADDGNGMSREVITSGTGHLGLRTIRQRVEKSGGSLRIEGESDGVTVTVELPVQIDDGA